MVELCTLTQSNLLTDQMCSVRAEGSERDDFRVFVLSNEDQHCHELRMMGINALSMRAVGGEGVGS